MGLEVLLRVREPERGELKQPIVVKLVDRNHCLISKDAAVVPFVSAEKDAAAAISKPFNFDHIFDIDVTQYSMYQYCQPLITSTFQQVRFPDRAADCFSLLDVCPCEHC